MTSVCVMWPASMPDRYRLSYSLGKHTPTLSVDTPTDGVSSDNGTTGGRGNSPPSTNFGYVAFSNSVPTCKKTSQNKTRRRTRSSAFVSSDEPIISLPVY